MPPWLQRCVAGSLQNLEQEEAKTKKRLNPPPETILDISTEELLSDTFKIETLTPAQRAAARIFDGRPLEELAEDHDVLRLVGGDDLEVGREALRKIEESPNFTEVVLLAAIRCAKTFMACSAGIRMTQNVDVSRLGPGETPRVSLVSQKLDNARTAFDYIRSAFESNPALSSRLVAPPKADSLLVYGPGGHPIEITSVAGSKAGIGLVSRWSAGVIFDEAPRMAGKEDGVVNLADARSAVLGRMLPGAQILYIGSPWAPFGPVYDMVQDRFGNPGNGMVVLRGTGPMLNPVWWTPEKCSELLDKGDIAYQTDVLGEFADPESGLFDPLLIDQHTRKAPFEVGPVPGGKYAAGIDPSEGNGNSNGWTLVIAQRIGDKRRECFHKEWRGEGPEEIWKSIAGHCARFGLTQADTDQYAASANAALAKRYGLTLNITRNTNASNLESYTNLATLTKQGLVEFPPDPVFRRDMLSILKRVTQSSQVIVLPKTADGRHCDFAPAFVKAMDALSRPGTGFRLGTKRIH